MSERLMTAVVAAAAISIMPAHAADNAAAGKSGNQVDVQVASLTEWNYDTLYSEGWSAERLMDADVYGEGGDQIGEVENFIVGKNGDVLAVITEVGGFWDIGDTHVAVPIDQVTVQGYDKVTVPVTEENVEDFSMFEADYLTQGKIENVQKVDDDLQTGPRVWKVSEMIGDSVFLQDGAGYGYVTDLIFNQQGKLQALVVSPTSGYGRGGAYAYPWYGYGYGWHPSRPYYNLPYERDEVAGMQPFDYSRLSEDIL